MKNNNKLKTNYIKFYLILFLFVFFSCGPSKESFEIKSENLKSVYNNTENVVLVIDNKENIEISSVEYFINEQKIGESVNNKPFSYNLSNSKFGLQDVKAIIQVDNEKFEYLASFQVFPKDAPKLSKFTELSNFPHDTKAYTQGVEFYNGMVYESTGQEGESTLRKTDYKTGKVIQNISLPADTFGEGLTILNDKIYQLTWQSNKCFVYDAKTFTKISEFNYPKQMEGWGLTNNGKELIMSDGSNKIYFVDPNNFKIIKEISVCSNQTAVDQINELEYINGKIWANVYQKTIVIVINPNNGAIEQVIDFTELDKKVSNDGKDVLNGIAYNKSKNTILIYGKNFDKTFEVKVN